jgi:hypothetical protein
MAKKTAALPSRDDLLGLPYWALVAFAARVGRRLLPLVEHCWETKIPDDAKYLAKTGRLRAHRSCVRQTELAASKAAIVDEQKLYDAMDVVGVSSSQAEYAAQLAHRKKGASQYAAGYVGSVIRTAGSLAFRRLKPDWNVEPGNIIAFTAEAGKAVGAASAVNAAVRADFDRLRRLIDEKGWTDDTPVRPSAFGPLWPDGPPQGWPQD